MLEREIGLRCLITYGLWVLTVLTWFTSWLADLDDLGRLSLIICGAAATTSIKGMFIEQHRRMKDAIAVTSVVVPFDVSRPR